jgi:predicted DNA-binding transcriptional regulator YafY
MNADVPADSGAHMLRWGTLRRLEFIDFRLFWNARINRKDLVDRFGISTQQATQDLERYAGMARQNVVYDTKSRAYVRAPSFSPQFVEGQAERFLLQLQALSTGAMTVDQTWFGEPPPHDVVTIKHRRVDERLLTVLVDAIRDGTAVQVKYWTMSGKAPEPRIIEPHALAYCDQRWHVRAWSRTNGSFRDFNINRCELLGGSGSRSVEPSFDYAWNMPARLVLAVNPDLGEHKREAVLREYDFDGDEFVFQTRLALLFYVKAQLNLEAGGLSAEKRQLVLVNGVELDEEYHAAMKMSGMAVARASSG